MDWTMWVEWFLKALIMLLILLTGFAYLTLYERRALARIQTRIGPNRAGPQGLLQPIADAVKLLFKEELIPAQADRILFILAPILVNIVFYHLFVDSNGLPLACVLLMLEVFLAYAYGPSFRGVPDPRARNRWDK